MPTISTECQDTSNLRGVSATSRPCGCCKSSLRQDAMIRHTNSNGPHRMFTSMISDHILSPVERHFYSRDVVHQQQICNDMQRNLSKSLMHFARSDTSRDAFARPGRHQDLDSVPGFMDDVDCTRSCFPDRPRVAHWTTA